MIDTEIDWFIDNVIDWFIETTMIDLLGKIVQDSTEG